MARRGAGEEGAEEGGVEISVVVIASAAKQPSEIGTIYVKFPADIVSEFLLLSFKEKDND